ncbi:hypothetical protein C2845_PM04G06450 [Panicum miliaceum]|uniref:Uncharacterized protein n=1 Tax=Panicum miliaceum TaxID=4540 RepID=A0A3L6QR36_PANMI|nr:hypothetical protein C2845_PM04G06450 [Panicum miliaceum]
MSNLQDADKSLQQIHFAQSKHTRKHNHKHIIYKRQLHCTDKVTQKIRGFHFTDEIWSKHQIQLLFVDLLAGEGVEDDADVDEHGGGDERDERYDGGPGGGPAGAAAEAAELHLHHVDERHHEEAAPGDGAHGGRQDPDAERGAVDPRRPAEDGGGAGAGGAAAVLRREGADELLEAERDEAGEEEAGEGEHVEGDEVGLCAVPGRAGVARAVGAAGEPRAVGGGAPRQAHERGEGEERVHVHDAVQRRDVDARAPAPAAPAAAAAAGRDVAVHGSWGLDSWWCRAGRWGMGGGLGGR